MSIGVEVRDEGGGRVVAVSGEIDLDSSPELWARLQEVLQGASRVAVDLRDVSYIDSSGVAVLIQGLKRAKKRGTRFVLVAPSSRVMGVLELAQLAQLFEIEPAERGD